MPRDSQYGFVTRVLGGIALTVMALGLGPTALADLGSDGSMFSPLPTGVGLNHSHIDGLEPGGPFGFVPPPPTGEINGGRDPSTTQSPVPEPATLALLLLGGSALLRRRR